MTMEENAHKWMNIGNSIVNALQMVGVGIGNKEPENVPIDKKILQKKPGVLSWINKDDERIFAQLLPQLREDQRKGIEIFLDDLAPKSPRNFAERTAKKINQTIFRLVVTGLDVQDAKVVLSTTVDKNRGTITNYDKDKQVVDHRKVFLAWVADQTNDSNVGAAETRKLLSAANIIASDESIEHTMQTIITIISKAPDYYKRAIDSIAKFNKKTTKPTIYIGIGTVIFVITLCVIQYFIKL